MSVLDAAIIAERAGKTLDEEQLWDLQDKLDAFQDDVELYLHRRLERKERTEVVEPVRDGIVNLVGPSINITSLTLVGDSTSTEVGFTYSTEYRDQIIVTTNQSPGLPSYTVVYTAGDVVAPLGLVAMMNDIVLREAIVGVLVASGAIAGFGVEGTSIQYGSFGPKSEAGSNGKFATSEINQLSKYRRRIIR